ncbi:MAG: hypothetical protein AAF824_04660 [Bacteroidota bacterium]
MSPRLRYTMELVFGEILGLSIAVIDTEESIPANSQVIDYRYEEENPLACNIPNVGLLHEMYVRDEWAALRNEEGIPFLFPVTGEALGFDPFSAIFYLASDYEKYVASHIDPHGRYDQSVYPSGKEKWFAHPLCELYAEKLWEFLHKHFPDLTREQKEYRVIWTFDLDNPWKYKYKPLYVQLGGFVKDLLNVNLAQVRERIEAWLTAKDPHEVYKEIEEHFPAKESIFFILLARKSPHDTRYTWRSPQLKQLVLTIMAKGALVGIHPSYTTSKDEAQLALEKEKLEKWVGPVSVGRQHYLKVSYPETYRSYIGSGIQTDYSACLYHMTGFPMGMMRSFYWFDLENNQQTTLRIQPTQIMDVSLQQYMRLSPTKAIREMDRIYTLTRRFGGELCILFHNEALSDAGEWKGWKDPILAWVKKVNQIS